MTREPNVRLVCESCAGALPTTSALAECSCGGLLDVERRLSPREGLALRRLFDGRAAQRTGRAAPRPQGGQASSGDSSVHESGVWRFRELLLPGKGRIVAHPEGNTRLYRREELARYAGLEDLAFKHEGENPTGSFKDRGMTVAVSQAVRTGATAVACASTGNTSASMAAYAAHAGLPAFVFVPAGKIAVGKLAQALAYGARTLQVRGDFDACLRLAREASRKLGVTLLNSVNPWRLEGQKTIIFELLQQLGWDPPDWILVPAGNLGNTSAFGKALRELKALGMLKRVPRLASIQARGANPFYRSFRTGFRRRFTLEAETVATAIRIGNPASHARAVRAIRETRGVVASVTDAEILDAKAAIDRAGIGCEPASAATLAGLRQLVRASVIRRGDSVVAVLTGHLLKDPEAVVRFHLEGGRGGNSPVEVEPSLTAVEGLLREPRC